MLLNSIKYSTIEKGSEDMNISYTDYALLLKALGDETMIKIFHMLSSGELCACKLLEEFHITQPTLSYHMKTLCDSGLVNGRKDGIWMKYSINKDSLELLKDLFNDIDNHYEEI